MIFDAFMYLTFFLGQLVASPSMHGSIAQLVERVAVSWWCSHPSACDRKVHRSKLCRTAFLAFCLSSHASSISRQAPQADNSDGSPRHVTPHVSLPHFTHSRRTVGAGVWRANYMTISARASRTYGVRVRDSKKP